MQVGARLGRRGSVPRGEGSLGIGQRGQSLVGLAQRRLRLRPLGGEALLERAGIAPQRRAETLSVSEFERLAGLVLESRE